VTPALPVPWNYLVYFLVGGGVVTVVVALAEAGSPFLAGIALLFPALTVVSFFFIGAEIGAAAAIDSAKSVVAGTIVAWFPYIITFILLAPKWGVPKALAAGIGVFIVIATIWFYVNQSLKLV